MWSFARQSSVVVLVPVLFACAAPSVERPTAAKADLRVPPLARGEGVSQRERHEDPDALHPATRAECEALVDANVEVELRAMGVSDSAIVARRKSELRADLADEIERCVGMETTARKMTCVSSAPSAAEIERCLR